MKSTAPDLLELGDELHHLGLAHFHPADLIRVDEHKEVFDLPRAEHEHERDHEDVPDGLLDVFERVRAILDVEFGQIDDDDRPVFDISAADID